VEYQVVSLTDKVAWSDDQVGATMGGDFVLMSVATGKYYGLDSISSEIWRRIEQPTPVTTLCSGLVADYAAQVQEVERDVLQLLNRFLRENLIKVVS
jgi:hypothetical protein